MGEIYKLTSPSGKVYIGQTGASSTDRWKSHIHDSRQKDGGRCRILNNAIKKYGQESFTLEILLVCDIIHLDFYESKFIELYSANKREYGYNLRSGGNLSKLADSTKALMSKNRRIKPHFQKPHTEDTKKNISNTLIDKVERISHNNTKLPKYIKYINWKDREGYAIVSHPQCKMKYFVSKNKSNDEKLEICKAYLLNLN